MESALETKEIIRMASGSADKVETCIPPIYNFLSAAPKVRKNLILDHDLRLTKASILYTDQVKLCSMGSWLATCFHLTGTLPFDEKQQLETIIGMASAVSAYDSSAKNILPELRRWSILFNRNPITLTKKERRKKSELKKKIPEFWEPLRLKFIEIPASFGFNEIELATNKGVLEIYPFSSSINGENVEIVQEYLTAVETLLSSSETHPMLDEQTSDLVRLALEEGKIIVPGRGAVRSKQIGLVANLFDRLPVFDVGMDELLDLRDELQRPLVNFRAEMINLSKDIETSSWDKDFSADVQDTYQSKIEPTLQEIEDKLKSTEFKEFWSRKIVDKSGFLATGYGGAYALGAAVSPLSGIGAALLATGIFAKAGQSELKEKISEIERNGLYFYYRMKEHLK